MSPRKHIISLTDIDRDLETERLTLEFSPVLEAQYREESVVEQRRAFIANCLIGCFLYDMFLLSDYFVSNETFRYYVIGRICVVTPLCLISAYLVWKESKFHQTLICMPFIGMAATLSFLLMISHGSFRSSYLFGDILLMMCGCAIARPRLPYAAIMILIQFMLYQATLLSTDIVDAESKIVGTLFCFSGGVVTIMTSYAIERFARRAFLLSRRVRLVNQKLETMAMTDPLTGLANRRCFEDATARFWAEPSNDTKPASMVLLDIDRFKSFNDSYGHPAGDMCLSTIARQIMTVVRGDDHLAVRFGGEEIVIFLPGMDFTEARMVAETVRLAIIDAAIPHPVLEPQAVVTASLGVATAPVCDCTAAELVIRADMALYAAKRGGRNRTWPPIGPLREAVVLGGAVVLGDMVAAVSAA